MIKGYFTSGDGRSRPYLDVSNFQISLEKLSGSDLEPPILIGKNDWEAIEKGLLKIDESELVPGCLYEVLLGWDIEIGETANKNSIYFKVQGIQIIKPEDDLPF